MNGTEIMALYEAKKARRVYLYRNGSRHSEAKCMVLNEKHIRDFGTFLNRVTSGLRAPVAIRNIYTPAEGHVISNLKDLEANHYYVAGGSEQFKKVEYGSRKRELQVPKRKIMFNDTTFHKATTSSRYRLPQNRPVVIHIYRNGDAHSGRRVLIPSNIARSRDHVLELVTTKAQLFTPAKRLCSLEGKPVEVSEIENGGKYVAMEGSKAFQKVSYSVVGNRVSIPPSWSKKAISQALIQPRGTRGNRELKRKPAVKGDVLGLDEAPYSRTQTLKRRKSIRPMAGRKNKEGREKAINDLRMKEDSVYGGSPVQYLDESFRTENALSVIQDDSTDTSPIGIDKLKQEFTDCRHFKDTGCSSRQSQYLQESHGSSSRGLVPLGSGTIAAAAAAAAAAATAKGTSTPGGSKEGSKGRSMNDAYSHVNAKYKTEYSSSKGGSQVASRQDQPEHKAASPFEKGVFHATDKTQYITSEYAEENHGNAFKAKAKRSEVIGAETVQEGQETEIEKPIDQLKAEVVEEEAGLEEGGAGLGARKDGQDTQPADDSQATEPINEGSMWPEYEVEEDEEDDNDNDDDEDDEDEEVEEEQEDNGKVDEEAAEEEDAQSPQETPRENTQTAGDLSEADTKQNDLGVAGNSTAVADSGGNTQSVQGADELQQAAPNQEEELPNDHPEGLQEKPGATQQASTTTPPRSSPPQTSTISTQ